MSCFGIKSYKDLSVQELNSLKEVCEKQTRNAKITGLVLLILSFLTLAATFTLWGLGTLPPSLFMGIGVFFTFGGHALFVISIAFFLASLASALAAGVRAYQAERSREELQQRQSNLLIN